MGIFSKKNNAKDLKSYTLLQMFQTKSKKPKRIFLKIRVGLLGALLPSSNPTLYSGIEVYYFLVSFSIRLNFYKAHVIFAKEIHANNRTKK